MSNHSTSPHFNKLLLTSIMSSLFSGHAHASYYIQVDNYGSMRNHTFLTARITKGYEASGDVGYVWIAIKNVGEFCYSGKSVGTSSGSGYAVWTPAIVESSGGTIAAGTAHCQSSIPLTISTGKSGSYVNTDINIFTDFDLSTPFFDDAKVYVGVGATGGKPSSTEYSNIFSVNPINAGCGVVKIDPQTTAPDPMWLCGGGLAADVTKVNSGYIWNCNGFNGGTNASCPTTHTAKVAVGDSKGTDFWLMFNQNNATALTLYITGATSTTGTVDVPGMNFSVAFAVKPGSLTAVSLPTNLESRAVDGIENKGIHITAAAEVGVSGLNQGTSELTPQETSDAFLALPTDTLGTEYIHLAPNLALPSQLGIVATENNTSVMITPTVTVGSRTAGTPYSISLNQGQVYQLQASHYDKASNTTADLSGSLIRSNKPIAVFGAGIADLYASSAYNYMVEQLLPISTWGKSFLLTDVDDVLRVLASQNGTQLFINGTQVAVLNKGQVYQQRIKQVTKVIASSPVLVTRLANFNDGSLRASMTLVPANEQWLSSYAIISPSFHAFGNSIKLVVPDAAVSATQLDGVTIPAASFYNNPYSPGFSWAGLAVTAGIHNLVSSQPFTASVLGYGYPAGMKFSKEITLGRIDLTPNAENATLNTSHCVNAVVLDQTNQAIAGVAVNFTVTGANPQQGQVTADAQGVAQYCYTGLNAGESLMFTRHSEHR